MLRVLRRVNGISQCLSSYVMLAIDPPVGEGRVNSSGFLTLSRLADFMRWGGPQQFRPPNRHTKQFERVHCPLQLGLGRMDGCGHEAGMTAEDVGPNQTRPMFINHTALPGQG